MDRRFQRLHHGFDVTVEGKLNFLTLIEIFNETVRALAALANAVENLFDHFFIPPPPCHKEIVL